MWKFSSVIFGFLSTLFPKTCINCRTHSETVCNTCLKNCARAVDSPFLYIRSMYSFKDPLIKKIIHSVKYFHRADLVPPLVTTFVEDLKKTKTDLVNDHEWILVPIPMSRLRKYMRGYNQAELIANELGRQLSFPVDTNILVRIKTPKQQVKTESKKERLNNQRNSFRIIGNVTGKKIILVDDVSTTGATLAEARRVLLNGSAKEVIAITIAH